MIPLMAAQRRKSIAPTGVRRSSSMKRTSVIGDPRRASTVQSAEPGMNGKDGSIGRKSMLAPEVPRRQSGVLQENGRKDSAAGEVSPAPKNGRLSQVADARRGSTVAPRRSSVVVSQELGAILGKPNGLAAEAGSPSDARAAQPIADLPTVGRLQGHAFFPELGQLTKAVAEHVSNLATMAGDLLEEQTFGDTSSDFRQGVRRATWVGPAWMTAPYREQAAEVPDVFSKYTGAQGLQKPTDPPADTLYASDSEEAQEGKDWDGVIDREFIKHRAAKLLVAAARQREKENQSAAATS
ncbi:g318 [Coccomyxa viridis]|uniref:G318 protein n=1 Tax=Coccomyxa viridis TaxID=1274662 RepID=A0ABP1FFF5_9CHLO